jgi:hypothetical protein
MEVPMQQFHLKLRAAGGQTLPDDGEMQEFPDLEAARAEAIEGLRELSAELIREGKPFHDRAVEITDGAGTHLATVQMSDALGE